MRKQIESTLAQKHIDRLNLYRPRLMPWTIGRSRTMASYWYVPQAHASILTTVMGMHVTATRIR